MIDDEIKTKNGMMEKFYERVAEKLHSIESYEAAKLTLFSLFTAPDISTHTTAESVHILVKFNCTDHDFIQLYRGGQDSYYLSISPPPEEGDISLQIAVVKKLMERL